jgi:hypothetical protein
VTTFAFRAAADLVVVVHAAFVIFMLCGGVLVARWPRLAWIHVPAAIWGALIEFAGWICPLTPLENHLRERAGLSAYQGDFIQRHLLPALYPAHVTRAVQLGLGAVALVVNAGVYWHVVRTVRRRQIS